MSLQSIYKNQYGSYLKIEDFWYIFKVYAVCVIKLCIYEE